MNINAIELGRLGGSVCSKVKSKSSKENGALGGRPIKSVTINDDGLSIRGCKYIYMRQKDKRENTLHLPVTLTGGVVMNASIAMFLMLLE